MTADVTWFLNGRFARATLTHDSDPAPVSIAACGGRFTEFRATPPLREELSGARVVDLAGATVIPGPVDAHCHLVSYGMLQQREADLRGITSLAELAGQLKAHRERQTFSPGDGRWLLGRGFDQELLAEQRWPTRADLDAIAPDRPLRITRICGHAVVANSAALHAASLDPDQNEAGFPSGVLTEERIGPVHAAIPKPTPEEWRQVARWACAEAARVGFVGVHSLMAEEREVRALLDLRHTGPLPVRVQMQLPYRLLEHAAGVGLRTGFGDEFLEFGAVKLFSDGSLGARTAALLEPYTDDPATSGELILPPEELALRVAEVYRAGFQVCIHAIGDRALSVTLDAMEAAAQVSPPVAPPRVEHASLVNRELIARMRALGVGAAVQPQFARSDSWAPERLGPERVRGCYAFRSLWEAGVPLAGSTDCPVEPLDAMAALGQLVARPDWSPHEGLPLTTALRVFSEGSYALQGRTGGRLAVGNYADFVALEVDPSVVKPKEIEHLQVQMTVVGGAVAYQANS